MVLKNENDQILKKNCLAMSWEDRTLDLPFQVMDPCC